MSPATQARTYDAVIVGGGHNGLVAAAYLAMAGRSCVVLERNDELGGAAVSHRAFPGFDARVSRYAYLVSLLPASIVSDLRLPLRLAPRRVASYTPDPRNGARRGLLVDGGDAAATKASFRAVTGGDAEHGAWERFYAMTRRIARAVFPTLTEPLRSRAQMRALLDDEIAWEAVFEQPLGEVLASTFGDDLVAGVALTDALIGTFAAAGDVDLAQNRCFLYHVIGRGTGDWQVPIGGIGVLAHALADAARSAGAELLTRAHVLALDPGADSVGVSVSSDAGEFDLRARHVLVNAAPAELERLLDRDPGPTPEGSQLKVNLLVSRLPRLKENAVLPEHAFAGTFHVNETAQQLQRAHDEAAGGTIPTLPPCELYCHSLTDPTILGADLRGRGVHTLTLFGLHMPARLFAKDPAAVRGAALEATLRSLDTVLGEPIAGCLLRGADGEPCLEVRTPLDLEQELHMPGGHIFHRPLAWPFAETDEQVGSWGVETAHPRILLCGAGARRGGGVSGVPGHNAAMAALGLSG